MTEQIEIDTGKLSRKDIDNLRQQLRTTLAQGATSDAFGRFNVLASHSSHTDNDGWT